MPHARFYIPHARIRYAQTPNLYTRMLYTNNPRAGLLLSPSATSNEFQGDEILQPSCGDEGGICEFTRRLARLSKACEGS